MRLQERLPYGKKFLMAREAHAPGGDHNSNWAISYGDMITLLLTFFILFFSIDRGKKESVRLGALVNEQFNGSGPSADLVWGVKAPEGESSTVYAGVDKKMSDKLPAAKTSVVGNRLIIEFPKTSFFSTAQYELTAEGRQALAQFAGIYRQFTGKMRLVVRGYTDNRPVKNKHYKFSDNLELSALRAISALRTLNEHGVPLELMRIGGYGETDKARGISPGDRLAYDRKVVLVIEPLDETERGLATGDWSREKSAEVPPKETL